LYSIEIYSAVVRVKGLLFVYLRIWFIYFNYGIFWNNKELSLRQPRKKVNGAMADYQCMRILTHFQHIVSESIGAEN
jgi:hypothetical protein